MAETSSNRSSPPPAGLPPQGSSTQSPPPLPRRSQPPPPLPQSNRSSLARAGPSAPHFQGSSTQPYFQGSSTHFQSNRYRDGVIKLKNYYSTDPETKFISIDKSKYNRDDLEVNYFNASFFVMIASCVEDVIKSIKYNVWSSTSLSNASLKYVYNDSRESANHKKWYPIFLFFSVKGSEKFCGVAEMNGPVKNDCNWWWVNADSGYFSVHWHIVKDLPFSMFGDIILQNKNGQQVIYSGDFQEISLLNGLKMLRRCKQYESPRSLLQILEASDATEQEHDYPALGSPALGRRKKILEPNRHAAPLLNEDEEMYADVSYLFNNVLLAYPERETPIPPPAGRPFPKPQDESDLLLPRHLHRKRPQEEEVDSLPGKAESEAETWKRPQEEEVDSWPGKAESEVEMWKSKFKFFEEEIWKKEVESADQLPKKADSMWESDVKEAESANKLRELQEEMLEEIQEAESARLRKLQEEMQEAESANKLREEVQSVEMLPKKVDWTGRFNEEVLPRKRGIEMPSPTPPLPQDESTRIELPSTSPPSALDESTKIKLPSTSLPPPRDERPPTREESTKIELPSTSPPPPQDERLLTRNESDMLLLRYLRQKRSQEVESVDKLLQDLYWLLPKEDLIANLYSKRYRKEVWNIVERMMCPDYVESSSDDDNISMVSSDYVAASSNGCISMMREEMSYLARCEKRLIELEKEYGEKAWYDSISYPMAPSLVNKLNAWRDRYPLPPDYCELSSRVAEVVSFGMQETKRYCMEDSPSPDVVSLLSLGGGTTLVAPGRKEGRIELNSDTFRNKYVFVFCINVPVLYCEFFQSLVNLCKELSLERARDCEMVMVARMNILADTERAFKRLFSVFPTSCLAVPYEDWDRRELIWKQLDCCVHSYQCFVYCTNGLLLTNFSANGDGIPLYGAEAFPFTEEAKEIVLANRIKLRTNGSLENLLRPYGSGNSPVNVYEFINPPQRIQRPITEVIENKHVGLYVCTRGKLIPRLRDLYEQCKLEHQEFEIVVLYLPVISGLDPEIFQEEINREMQKHGVCGWWCLPFNNSVSMRFWAMTKDYECDIGFGSADYFEDKLIIVGTGGGILDMYGAKIYKDYGHVYPFTREAVVQKKMEEVKKERPLKLLSGSELFRGDDPSVTVSADELLRSKKNIVVFMGRPRIYTANGSRYGFERLVSQYVDMKKRGKEFEVVFIEYCSVVTSEPPSLPPLFSDMPWYVLRHDDRTSVSPLAECLRELFLIESLVGFGKDRRICSVHTLQQIRNPIKYLELCLNESELGLNESEVALASNIHRLLDFTEYMEI